MQSFNEPLMPWIQILWLLKIPKVRKPLGFRKTAPWAGRQARTHHDALFTVSLQVSNQGGSRELEVVALRHQLAVLRRQRPGRPKLTSLDRLLWVWLYRVWPRCLEVMVLVKSATVVQWHRAGRVQFGIKVLTVF